MSDNVIRVGDLVMVVRPSECGCCKVMGRAFVVQAVCAAELGYCHWCRRERNTPFVIQPNGFGMDLSRLLKINPPAAAQTQTRTRTREAV